MYVGRKGKMIPFRYVTGVAVASVVMMVMGWWWCIVDTSVVDIIIPVLGYHYYCYLGLSLVILLYEVRYDHTM